MKFKFLIVFLICSTFLLGESLNKSIRLKDLNYYINFLLNKKNGERFVKGEETHAKCIYPLLRKESFIFIHNPIYNIPTIFQDGEIFNSGIFLESDEKNPIILIRPIDDSQEIEFILSIKFNKKSLKSRKKVERAIFMINLPLIFSPEIKIESVDIRGGNLKNFYLRKFYKLFPRIIVEFIRKEKSKFISINIRGKIILNRYDPTIPADRASNLPEIKIFSSPLPNREYKNDYEKKFFSKIAKKIRENQKSEYEILLKTVNSVCENMIYLQNDTFFTPFQILLNKKGDCNDYVRITSALLRFNHIPVREIYGAIFDYNILEKHTWLEVGFPERDEKIKWVIVDPTLADREKKEARREKYVGTKKEYYIYPINIKIASSKTLELKEYDIFLNSNGKFNILKSSSNITGEVERVLEKYLKQKSSLISKLKLRIYKDFPAQKFGNINILKSNGKGFTLSMVIDFLGNVNVSISMENGTSTENPILKNFKNIFNKIKIKNLKSCIDFNYTFNSKDGNIIGAEISMGRYFFNVKGRKFLSLLKENFIYPNDFNKLNCFLNNLNYKNIYPILNNYLNSKLMKEKLFNR